MKATYAAAVNGTSKSEVRGGRFRSLAGIILAAALFTVACPPYEWSLAAWVVPGLLIVSTRGLRRSQAFLGGALYGVLIGTAITAWAPRAALTYFEFNAVLARTFIVGVHLVNPGIPCGLMLAAFAALARRVGPVARAAIGAWLWVASELLRTWSLGWELLGHTQFQNLRLIQIADIGGVYAVSFIMALASIAVAEVVADFRWTRLPTTLVLRRLALPTALVMTTLGYGVYSERVFGHPSEARAHTVAVVQGNVPNSFRWKRAFFAQTVAMYANLTAAVRAAGPDLIIWPENAVSFYINQEPLLRAQLADVAAIAPAGLLVGGPRLDDGHRAYNSVYLLGRDGSIRGSYDKQRLLPFAEYDPLPRFGRAPAAERDVYTAGASARPLQAGAVKIGTVICYEVLFPYLIRDLVRHGAEVLVNLSNDSWMDAGDGAAPRQHFSMAIFRAIETRRYLVRAAASGVSGFVRPYGDTYSLLPSATAGTAVAAVVPRQGQTAYVRWGDSVWVLGGVAACIGVFGRSLRLQRGALRR